MDIAPNFRILLVSYYCPTRAHAGGLRILDIYAQIRERFPGIQLDLFTHHRPAVDWSIDETYKIFDHVYLSPVSDLAPDGLASLRKEEVIYDVVDLQFHPAGYHLKEFRDIGKKILFTPMESMVRVFLINLINAVKSSHKIPLKALKSELAMAREEAGFCRQADLTVCVSRPDAFLLRIAAYPGRVRPINTCLSKFEVAEALSGKPVHISPESKDFRIIFVAYFGSATNVNALRWYLDHVHPIIRQRVPGYVLSVVGRGDLSSFSGYKDASVDFVGEVPRLAPAIMPARVGIAPALSGSGFRGKINLYSILGVPSVVSPLAAKGLSYNDAESIFVARSPTKFAERCVQLLTDLPLNRKMSAAAQKLCFQHYVWESKWQDIYDTYDLANAVARRVETGVRTPLITVLVPSYNHARYLRERVQSIYNQTYKNIEVILIDDHSTDNSHDVATSLLEDYNFMYIRNEKNSGSPFAAWEKILTLASGDYIWICESDDIAEPGFLETAVRELEKNRQAAIFYCHSWIIDSTGQRIGHTSKYFHDLWKNEHWDADFTADGAGELKQFQPRGQTVPNMSSTLIRTPAFRAAYNPLLKKFKLTGDWIFVGYVYLQGQVIFSSQTLNNYRRHAYTARIRTNAVRLKAEFFLTRYTVFRESRRPINQFACLMRDDIREMRSENLKISDILKASFAISPRKTLGGLALFFVSLLQNQNAIVDYFTPLKKRSG